MGYPVPENPVESFSMGYPVPCSEATIYKCLLISNVIFCTLLKSKIHNDNLWFIYLLCWYGRPILLVFKASLIEGHQFGFYG